MSEFLVVYDYGMGGVWGFATAESELDLTQTSPELQVIHEIPQWMTGDVEAKVRTASSFDVNDPGTYPEWLRGVVRGRRMDRE
jgi:translation initiation factor 2 gamma subunit (eIF-2gamma)